MHSNNLTVIPVPIFINTTMKTLHFKAALKPQHFHPLLLPSQSAAAFEVHAALWNCLRLKDNKAYSRDISGISGISGMYSTSCEHSEAKAPGTWRMNKCRYASWALFAFFEQGIYNSDCWNQYTFAWEIHLYQTLLTCICALATINIHLQYADTSGEAESPPFKVCTKSSTMAGPNSRTQPWRWMLNADLNSTCPTEGDQDSQNNAIKSSAQETLQVQYVFHASWLIRKANTAGPKIVLFKLQL